MRREGFVLTLTTGGLLLALAAGCASNPKTANASTEIIDGTAAATAPVARPEPVAVAAPTPVPAAPACTLARVQFAFDSTQLDEPARQALQRAADCLVERKPADLVIEGHCDERGTAAYNLALGQKRAAAVKAYLADLGVKIAMQPISFGKELPLVRGEGEGAWSQNRRAELRLTGERRTDGAVVAGR